MFIIDSIEVDGLWEKFSIETKLFDGVNIFIGKNGTGKTTFINLIQAVLSIDLQLLETQYFNKVSLLLRHGDRQRKISVEKNTKELPFNSITYKIGRNSYNIPLISNNIDRRRVRMHPHHIEMIDSVKREMSSLVNMSWLSVYRELIDESFNDQSGRKQYCDSNAIDRRLEDLMRRLTSYQLQLESEMSKISEQFRKDVLACMLYDPHFDTFDIDKKFEIQGDGIEDGLLHAYQYLGALDNKITKRIIEHSDRLEKSLMAVKEYHVKNTSLNIDDVLPLSLLRRTEKIVKLSTDMEDKKRDIFKQMELYLNTLRNYIEDKRITLDTSHGGTLLIEKGGRFLQINELSSGEKQLLILLTEAILQRKEKCIFIADEPELSLHIEWQRNVISSIRELNPEAQIIIATHSPEIAGKWYNNIISMENITNG